MDTITFLSTHLQSAEEAQMLFHSESVKEHVVLGTDTEAVPYLVHVCLDTVAIDDGVSRGWSVQPWEGGREGGRERGREGGREGGGREGGKAVSV